MARKKAADGEPESGVMVRLHGKVHRGLKHNVHFKGAADDGSDLVLTSTPTLVSATEWEKIKDVTVQGMAAVERV